MKILVISDTHGRIECAKWLVEKMLSLGVKTLIHCGDHIGDATLIEKLYKGITVHAVYGNCDSSFKGTASEVIDVEGVKIYICHGHKYGVKWEEYEELIIDAKAHEAKIAVFGHSHCAYLGKKEGVFLMNPGSLSLPRDSKYPSYGIIDIEQGMIKHIELCQITEKGLVITHPASVFTGF